MDEVSSRVSRVQLLPFGFSHAAKLGAQLADLHLENKRLGETLQKEASRVGMTSVGQEGPHLEEDIGLLWVSGWGYATAI